MPRRCQDGFRKAHFRAVSHSSFSNSDAASWAQAESGPDPVPGATATGRVEGECRPLTAEEGQCLGALVQSRMGVLMASAIKLMGVFLKSKVDPEDLVQESVRKLQVLIEQGHHRLLHEPTELKSLLQRILRNHIADQHALFTAARRGAGAADAQLSESKLVTASTMTPSRTAARHERAEKTRDAVAALESFDRVVVQRCGQEGSTFADVARELGVKPDKVRNHFVRCVTKLRAKLRGLCDSVSTSPDAERQDQRS
jgi:RNA polymerase sigma factor (sigma-70 family)